MRFNVELLSTKVLILDTANIIEAILSSDLDKLTDVSLQSTLFPFDRIYSERADCAALGST